MPSLSLPLYEPPRRPAPHAAPPPPIDRSKPYPSCPWLEEGIAFNRRSLHACLIVHHGRGFPHLCDYNGGEIDLAAIQAARSRIIKENQSGKEGGHAACRGCPHLVTRRWPRPRHPIRLMGIAQFTRCNIECSYCYLQTQDPASFAAGFDPYPVLEPIRALARAGALSPDLIVDWGGGEPTIYEEFDAVLRFLAARRATTWIHTNGTRFPRPIRDGLPTKRIHVLCSVDAGTRQTWRLIKGKDLLDAVWANLDQYIRLGCRVVLKYIVKEENCGEQELRAFVAAAARVGATELVLDIDYDDPDPSPAVVAGLRLLKGLATMRGMDVTFGSTGAFFTPEIDVAGRVHDGRRSRGGIRLFLKGRLAWIVARTRLAIRGLRRG